MSEQRRSTKTLGSKNSFLLLHWEKEFFSLTECSRDQHGRLHVIRGTLQSLSPPSESIYEQTTQQLREITSSWGLCNAPVHCVLPSSASFFRTITLEVPSNIEDTTPLLARLEAEEIIPLPLEEVVWDYQCFPSSQQESIQVAYLATKIKFLEPLCETIVKAGLQVASIDTVPCALVNALKLEQWGQLSNGVSTDEIINQQIMISGTDPLALGTDPLARMHRSPGKIEMIAETTLLIHVETSTTTLLLVEPHHKFSCQTISTEQLEEELRRLLSAWHAEESIPTHIVLNANNSVQADLSALLTRTLQRPIVFLNQLLKDQISIAPEARAFSETYGKELGILWGGAMHVRQEGVLKMNLLPPSLIAKRQQQQRWTWFLKAVVFLSILLLACTFYFSYTTKQLALKTAHASFLLDQEKKSLAESENALKKFQELQERVTPLLDLVEARAAWPQLINELQRCLPSRYLWITKLSPVTEAKQTDPSITAFEIEGLYLENPRQAAVVDDFVNQLKKSEFFAIPEKNQESIIALRCTPDGSAYAYPFKLVLPLRKPLNRVE